MNKPDLPSEIADDREPILLREIADGILVLTLNRPRYRNPLSDKLIETLQGELDDAANKPGVRVVVLAANGPVFSGGHDIKELTAARSAPDGGETYFRETFAASSKLMQTIVSHPRPVIAEVRGMATAAGCQMVASCDLVIAAEDAAFATPGVNIGLFCSTPMVAMSRKVGANHAMEMLLTGEPISARRAAEIGLVNRVVAADRLREAVMELARTIGSKSLMTVETGKNAFYRQIDMPLSEAYRFTSTVMIENLLRPDAKEGMAAFMEKRTPVWNDGPAKPGDRKN